MDETDRSEERPRTPRRMVSVLVAVGLGLGGYGIASAASGDGSAAADGGVTTVVPAATDAAPATGAWDDCPEKDGSGGGASDSGATPGGTTGGSDATTDF